MPLHASECTAVAQPANEFPACPRRDCDGRRASSTRRERARAICHAAGAYARVPLRRHTGPSSALVAIRGGVRPQARSEVGALGAPAFVARTRTHAQEPATPSVSLLCGSAAPLPDARGCICLQQRGPTYTHIASRADARTPSHTARCTCHAVEVTEATPTAVAAAAPVAAA